MNTNIKNIDFFLLTVYSYFMGVPKSLIKKQRDVKMKMSTGESCITKKQCRFKVLFSS